LFKSWGCLILSICAAFTICLAVSEKAGSEILSGVVNKEHIISRSGVVLNKDTGNPIAGASVSIPAKGIETKTNDYGEYRLDLPDERPLILAVRAKGYKPFSLILEKNKSNSPMIIAIAEQERNEIIIDTGLHHLGDNKYSDNSANSTDFSAPAAGPYYFKEFFIDSIEPQRSVLLKIGSIIGIDTKTAQSMRQSKVLTSSSTPVKVFFNSQHVGEIDYNGNDHIIKIPSELVRTNSYNHVRIETGININSRSRKDYDDIEFIHLILEFK